MKQVIIIILFLLAGSRVFAQQDRSLVHKGNELYQQKKYKEAEQTYKQALQKNALNVQGSFNTGDALFKQKKYEDAMKQFGELAEKTTDKKVAAAAYHNIGNSLLTGNKLEESIEAYKKALINNPKDDETRYNLAYAQEKLKKQQQDDKKNGKDKNKDKNKDKDKKDKDKDKKDNKGDKDKDKDKQDQDKKNQDKKDQDKKDQDKQNQDKKDQQGQKPQVSKEDAQRMLDALNNNEKQTQDKLKNKKLKGAKVQILKNW